jgi:hypothetical protein
METPELYLGNRIGDNHRLPGLIFDGMRGYGFLILVRSISLLLNITDS